MRPLVSCPRHHCGMRPLIPKRLSVSEQLPIHRADICTLYAKSGVGAGTHEFCIGERLEEGGLPWTALKSDQYHIRRFAGSPGGARETRHWPMT